MILYTPQGFFLACKKCITHWLYAQKYGTLNAVDIHILDSGINNWCQIK